MDWALRKASGATRVLTLGKAITSDSGNTLGALMVDMPLSSIDKLLSRMVADDSITLFVRHDGSENTRDIISVINPRLMPKVLPTAENTYSSLQGLKQGVFTPTTLLCALGNWYLCAGG